MLKQAVLAAVAVGTVSSTALGWSEEFLSLKDPSGHETTGEVRIGQMQGYYCASRPDAEVLAAYMRGTKIAQENLAMSLGQCVSDSRHVTGVFPEGQFPVVYVRHLSSVDSWYFVPGFFVDQRQQDAHAH